jgi:hypothetical protein
VVTLNDTGNTNFQGAKGVAINTRYQKAPTAPDAYNGQGVGFHQYHSAIPLLKEWNLDVQQQIATSMEFEWLTWEATEATCPSSSISIRFRRVC